MTPISPMPDGLAIVAEGVRLAVGANGSFAVGDGVLPVSRQLEAFELPARLGSGWLFSLRAPDDRWLLRAATFTGDLKPIGRIVVPSRSVVPGFEGLYATSEDNGSVLAIDPSTGRAEEALLLPPSAEQGPIVIVDDWFGATLDPLRGLLVTLDAGQHWLPFTERFSGPERDPTNQVGALHAAQLPSYRVVRAIRAVAGRLEVEFSDQRRLWFSRRRNVGVADPPAPREPLAVRLAQWVEQQRSGALGSWPIELAVTSGALVHPGLAVLVSRGVLALVRLRDGRVVGTTSAGVAQSARCQAYAAETNAYFLCRTPTATSVHWLTSSGRLEQLAAFAGQREVIAVSSHGLTLRERCAWRFRNAQHPGSCVVRPRQTPLDVAHPSDQRQPQVVASDASTIAILQPPTVGNPGAIRSIGRDATTVRLVVSDAASPRQRDLIVRGRWLERPHFVAGNWINWVMLGDELMGVHVTADGLVTPGEIVEGAAHSCTFEAHAIVADVSGYAKESCDGGLSYQRPRLPDFVTQSVGTSHDESQQWIGSAVGCAMGNWLRVGWSKRTTASDEPTLEPVSAPDPIRISSTQRKIPRIHCEFAPEFSLPRAVARSPQTKLEAVNSAASRGVEQRTLPPEATAELRRQLHSSYLRLVGNRDRTRLGYLVTSGRLRLVDRKWLVYPIHAQTGNVEEPTVIPMERGIRPCDPDEDGWVAEVNYDLVAHVELGGALGDTPGRVRGLLRLSGNGVCAEPVSIGGGRQKYSGGQAARRRKGDRILGVAVDQRGRTQTTVCEILEAGGQ